MIVCVHDMASLNRLESKMCVIRVQLTFFLQTRLLQTDIHVIHHMVTILYIWYWVLGTGYKVPGTWSYVKAPSTTYSCT